MCSRGKAFTLTKDFVRRTWWLLLVVPVVCVVPFIPLSVLITGTARAVVITATLTSGIWLDALFVVIWTGSASQFMGTAGEVWTAQE